MVQTALDVGDPKVSSVEDGDTPKILTQATTGKTDGETPSKSNRESPGIWMSELDDSIFEASKIRAKLTRKQKWENCLRYSEAPN